MIQASGGLGLFLVGMIVMTDGLRKLAGESMRDALMHFTHSPLSGAVTGAVATAVLQSSSAMTVAAVGFVSAGLLAFANALGVIFGANIGTTMTGWLVALLGFKLQLGTVVLPLILVGALLRLFGKDRPAATGLAMAGFGLIFVGISMMQTGMAGLQDVVTPDKLPGDSWHGRLLLVGIGILMTIITQSSSAGVATAITAVHVGTINFNQAAALVIGMDIGTTVTAYLATIGASVAAKRTGLSHVMYNLFTGSVALLFITPFVAAVNFLLPGQISENPELLLVAFHTTFNLLGVSIMLPFTPRFARMMATIVPEKGPVYARRLPRELLDRPALALNVVQTSVQRIYAALLHHVAALLKPASKHQRANLGELQRALQDAHNYLDDIQFADGQQPVWNQAVALLHAIDHLLRLLERCEEEEGRVVIARNANELADVCDSLLHATHKVLRQMQHNRYSKAAKSIEKSAEYIRQNYDPLRQLIINKIPSAEVDVTYGTDMLEAVRWLKRCSGHMEDVSAYLRQSIHAVARENEQDSQRNP